MTTAKSTIVTNNDASPPTANPVHYLGGRVRIAMGEVALATTDLDAADIILLASLPTNANITGIWLKNTDMDSNATETLEFDVGVFTTAGVAKDAGIYYDGSADNVGGFQNANIAWVDVYRGVASDVRNQLWADAGDSTDPGGLYTIGVTVQGAAATAVAGTLGFKIEYTVD